MNKTAIRNFAMWARTKLISDTTKQAQRVGITPTEILEKLPSSTEDLEFYEGVRDPLQAPAIAQRQALVRALREKEADLGSYTAAFDTIIEEVAYTWFNRLIAIRFMEVNGYLPGHLRVLSSIRSGKREPDMVTTPFETGMDFTEEEADRIDTLRDANQMDELFRMLFIKQCNDLHALLPDLFEVTNDYTELLLSLSYIDTDGVVPHLVTDIPEADFDIAQGGQVEIIGWLYQYYISEKHDEIVGLNKANIKKQDIPAATQLFTPDWVVRYMVDNSLGRYWMERHPESSLKEKLTYLVTAKDGSLPVVNEPIAPTEVTFFDDCMGSAHILVYAFDVLLDIYTETGYSEREAAIQIVEHNLYGMDIDKRAYQLAYFAVMMKARQYNRRVLTRGITHHLAEAEETNHLPHFHCEGLTTNETMNAIGEYLITAFQDAKERGTLITVEDYDYEAFQNYLSTLEDHVSYLDLFMTQWLEEVRPLMMRLAKQAQILSKKYDVVCTNPPYMNKFDTNLKKFLTQYYKDYYRDLFSVFMYRNFDFCKEEGYSAFMTPNVWMFISSYERLRSYITTEKSIASLIQLAKGAFFQEATVDVCAFVLKNSSNIDKGYYIRLEDFKGGMEVQRQKVLAALADKDCGYFYETDQANFSKIPGAPIAYWVSPSVIQDFQTGTIMDEVMDVRQGLATADNDRFLRLWYEVSDDRCKFDSSNAQELIESGKKWVPYNKGGERRQWYGNYDYLVNWERDGFEIKNFVDNKGKLRSRPQNTDYYFREAITWGLITSGGFSIRYRTRGGIHDVSGMSAFSTGYTNLKYLLGILGTPVANYVFKILNPTINLQVGDFKNFPVLYEPQVEEQVISLVDANIALSREDWDSFETSWDFKRHPLVSYGVDSLDQAFARWEEECTNRFNRLKANEEELNRIFIDIYGLQEELTPQVLDKDVTVRLADVTRDVKSLLSYAVGCMLGRYSLDVEGLAYAGGDFDASRYVSFIPDADNCIPITDEEYFHDDIVGLLCEWLSVVYGKESLESNVDFIADALGTKGVTSREKIRAYFVKDFMKDHLQVYKKRPIYWQFDSGKNAGFKGLVYMHRWTADTTGHVRIEYLHRMQQVYESEIARMQQTIDATTDPRELTRATKRKEKLTKQLKEARDFDANMGHLALQRIAIDLDDGVKVNYEKVQTDGGVRYPVLVKV